MKKKGDAKGAADWYAKAEEGLQSLKTMYPDWNKKIVDYRLAINGSIERIGQRCASGRTGADEERKPGDGAGSRGREVECGTGATGVTERNAG